MNPRIKTKKYLCIVHQTLGDKPCAACKTETVAAPSASKSSLVAHERLDRCIQRHILKTWPEYFEKLLDGTKTFELREDDRGFDVGHELVLVEYSPVADCVTGRKVCRRVTYIMRGPAFGLDAGWCVMALDAPGVLMSRRANND